MGEDLKTVILQEQVVSKSSKIGGPTSTDHVNPNHLRSEPHNDLKSHNSDVEGLPPLTYFGVILYVGNSHNKKLETFGQAKND